MFNKCKLIAISDTEWRRTALFLCLKKSNTGNHAESLVNERRYKTPEKYNEYQN